MQARFRAGSLDEDLIRYVSRLSWMDRGPRLAVEFLEERGIAVVIEPLLRGEQAARIDAAALRGRGGAPAIALTLRQDRLDHFWSALITALVLAWKHLGDDGDGEIIAVDIEARRGYAGGGDAGSHGARDLAAEILIPRAVWQRSAAATDPTAETIRALAAQMQISPAIVAGRVRDEREDFTLFPELMGQRRVRALFPEMRGGRRGLAALGRHADGVGDSEGPQHPCVVTRDRSNSAGVGCIRGTGWQGLRRRWPWRCWSGRCCSAPAQRHMRWTRHRRSSKRLTRRSPR